MKRRLWQLALGQIWAHAGKEQGIAHPLRSPASTSAETAPQADGKEAGNVIVSVQDAQSEVILRS